MRTLSYWPQGKRRKKKTHARYLHDERDSITTHKVSKLMWNLNLTSSSNSHISKHFHSTIIQSQYLLYKFKREKSNQILVWKTEKKSSDESQSTVSNFGEIHWCPLLYCFNALNVCQGTVSNIQLSDKDGGTWLIVFCTYDHCSEKITETDIYWYPKSFVLYSDLCSCVSTEQEIHISFSFLLSKVGKGTKIICTVHLIAPLCGCIKSSGMVHLS